MRRFSHGQMGWLRRKRRSGATFTGLLERYGHAFTRDELCEAWDACVRSQSDEEASRRLNLVLALQEDGAPLINGRPATDVLSHYGRKPMFD